MLAGVHCGGCRRPEPVAKDDPAERADPVLAFLAEIFGRESLRSEVEPDRTGLESQMPRQHYITASAVQSEIRRAPKYSKRLRIVSPIRQAVSLGVRAHAKLLGLAIFD